jgi:mRNA (2'-O-methyladenosine-N6-)-methyltransferase
VIERYVFLIRGENARDSHRRLVPHGHKLELFGRKHNIRPGWLTLGNQRALGGFVSQVPADGAVGESQVAEKSLHDRLTKRYPHQKFHLTE